MKREFFKGFTMLMFVVVLALAAAVASANPQSANKVVADIPFEFSVGYKTLPAGEYAVRTITSSGSAVMIQSADGKTSAVRLSSETEQKKNKRQARLVFHRYGERYFLAEVWNGADGTGRKLLKSGEESAIESEFASIAANSETPKTFETVEVLAAVR